jgi:hypothetical protein
MHEIEKLIRDLVERQIVISEVPRDRQCQAMPEMDDKGDLKGMGAPKTCGRVIY